MSEDAKLTRKPAKKSSSRSFQSTIIAAAASSRFRKRQPSETSISSSQGWSASNSTVDLNSSPVEEGRRVPSRATTHHEEPSTSSTGDNVMSYNSRGQVRLVPARPRRPSDQALPVQVESTELMNTVTEAPESFFQSPEAASPRSFTPTRASNDQPRTTPPSRSTTPNPRSTTPNPRSTTPNPRSTTPNPRSTTPNPRSTTPNPRSTTPNLSSSRNHWNQLRNAIVPGSVSASSPPVPPMNASQTTGTVPPPRSQTPKPSRFAARLGFRQVVDQTRDFVHDETSRFEVEIYQACISARFGEIRQKAERDGSQAGYLPFMSTASLPLSTTSPAGQPGGSGSTPSNETVGRLPPSLRLLHQTLIRYTPLSGPSGPIASLPYEPEVLSVLLLPFAAGFSQRGNEERWLAVETFELAAKTWRASSPQREIDRLLWCCKAALIPTSAVRSRVLGTLSSMLFSSTPVQGGNPLALQNLLQGLLLLLHSFSNDPQHSLVDIQVVRELLIHVTTGASGELDQQEVETEYEALWGMQDDEETVRNQIIAEGVVRCMQNGSETLRRWVLHESVEAYWPSPMDTPSPLYRKIMARRLSAFLRASLSLLSLDATHVQYRYLDLDSDVIIRLLPRALLELAQLPLPKHINDARALVVELAMELLAVESHVRKQEVVKLFCGWCDDHGDWKQCLETGLSLFIERAEWPRITKALQAVVHEIPQEGRDSLISVLFRALHTRMVIDPAPHPLPGLTLLLRSLAQLHRQQFYKPLFSLAGASKDLTLVGHLGIVTALARHLPEFWIQDPEMMSVAMMGHTGGSVGRGNTKEGEPTIWGKTRVGQSLIMVELVRCVRQLTHDKKDQTSPPDASQTHAYRFFTGLEARLAILLDDKEKSVLVPFSQRILISVLFLEIRLFTRSLKPAPWLQKVVTWAAQSYMGARLDCDYFDSQQHVDDDAFDEVLSTISKIQSIHIACWQTPPPSTRQRSTMVLSPTFDPRTPTMGSVDHPEVNSEAIKEREELMASLATGVTAATLRLLVAMCALLTSRDHRIIGPVLWSHFLDEDDPRIVTPTCFLLTHCLEKTPKDVTNRIEDDRRSLESTTRIAMIRRLMTLFAWRSQLLSQTYLYDRARRRPFRMARQPIAFVAIDAGSGHYVHEQTEEDRKNLPGGTLPFELRKRLAEVGWEQDDQPIDTRLERVKAPISLFPASQLERFSFSAEHATMTPARSAESVKQLLRRKSSSSGHHAGTKRRPVFVPALVSMFSSIATLAIDPDPIVASFAREAILLMLRDDPVMLCRPVMDMLSADLIQVNGAVSVLSAFLHIHHRLPPSASHHIFSHLGGFLKHISRDSNNPKALQAFSYTAPLLSKLITQVSNLSIRDLRRAKFEIYVFPSGSLWFPPTAPSSTMFPQSLGPVINPFDELPPQLVGVLMVRTAQNMLLLDMLKHKPQEVHAIRKSLSRLVLPGQDSGKDLHINKFLPRRCLDDISRKVDFRRASLALSRSHLLLLAQIFRSMSRNFNGRAELAQLFDGLNNILLAHGDDIGIVSHALIACMIAVTRFKRLVSSAGGFALFMPSLLKVYAEAEGHAGIRHAIHYASSRFYAIHQDAFVFQCLDLASSILAELKLPEDQDWFAKNIYELFSTLKSPLHRNAPDAAGIRGSNMAEEREALIATTVTDEAPRNGSQDSPHGEQLKKILAVGQYDNMVLNLDDFVRLLLTVIAHDPTVLRAQNFLGLLRRMAPEFYNGSNSAREVLRDGIDALGSALFSKAPRQRVHESIPSRQSQKNNIDVSYESDDGTGISYDPSAPCDPLIVRREYLNLVAAYSRMGGDLRHGTLRRSLDIVKGLLKEPTRLDPHSEGKFLHELTDTSLSRLGVTPKQAIALLSDLAPVVKAFSLSIDCSGTLDTISGLIKRPELANNDSFVQLVLDQIVAPVLEACDDAASENTLLSLPMRSAVVALISQSASLRNADIISYIERQTPSPGFLAGIVLPLCLTMKTSAEIAIEKQWRHQDRLAKHDLVFVRLLVYAMDSCHTNVESETGRSSPLPGITRRDSQRSKQSSLVATRTPLATLTIVLQIIKVIIVRASDDLSRGLVGIWARLARFLQHLLDDGDARFALPSGPSPAPSPWQSPVLGPRPHSHSSDTHVPSSPAGNVPRVVDYLTWSLLEYLCCASSPLTLQMRLWMQEKVHDLDSELKVRETTPHSTNGSRRLSSSVFARPRGASTSPEALRASHGLSATPSELNLSASSSTDFASYSRFSSRGSLQPSQGGLRIVHLGPTKDPSQHMFLPIERSSSQDSNLKSLARTSHIGLASLVKSTVHRIRLVQTCMGYDRIFSIDGLGGDVNNVDLKAWTKASTLASIVAEAKELMDEFPENFYETIGSDFVDVPSNFGFGSTQNSPVKGMHT